MGLLGNPYMMDAVGEIGTNPMLNPSLIGQFTRLPGAPQLPQQQQRQHKNGSLLSIFSGGMLGSDGMVGGLLGGGGASMKAPGGGNGMLTFNGGFGGVNPYSGYGFGSMAPGGQTTMHGGYQMPTDALNLPF
jgi:hypothetical protein